MYFIILNIFNLFRIDFLLFKELDFNIVCLLLELFMWLLVKFLWMNFDMFGYIVVDGI